MKGYIMKKYNIAVSDITFYLYDDKVALSPHQVAWHLNRGPGSFVLVHCIHLKQYRLYPGYKIEELFRLGLNLEPLVLGSLDACACSLREFVPVPEVYK
jgi:hypothetical protein